jgi:hypothetical protein
METINVQNVPKSLNGFPVTMATPHENGHVTVLVTRKDDPMPYVVATHWAGLGNSWSWGHYSDTPEQAMNDYLETSKRNAARGKIG